MKEFKVNPHLLYDLEMSKVELENGYPSNKNLEAFRRKISTEWNSGGEDSSMQMFLGMQRVSDKACADCIEAILGACVKTVGIERTFKLLEMLEIVPCNDGEDIARMLHIKLSSPRTRANADEDDVDNFLVNSKKLEEAINYTFKDRAYLLQALTHPSYPRNRITGCYQVLEFLGDAVLDFLITAYITERCPSLDPGKITDLRSALVNNVTLACLCVRHNIHLHLLYENSSLHESIGQFADLQQQQNNEVADNVQILLEETDVEYKNDEFKHAEYTKVPKALGDVLEAIIGAIFLDSGNNLEVCVGTFFFISDTVEFVV